MRHATPSSDRPPGHPAAAVAAIGSLSFLLAAGLQLLGILARTDAWIAQLVSRGGAQTFPQRLPGAAIWPAVALFSFGLAFAILRSPGMLPRLILWISAMILVATWAPVLSLAAYQPTVSAAWIATAWSGACAIFYASHHRMTGDTHPENG